ncbi:MAG: coenzyme F420-0:L-glutamate ligase [Candidatus Thorarchaeota archaeon]
MIDNRIEIIPVIGVPLIHPGDDIPCIVRKLIHNKSLRLESGDILVVTHTIVSIAEKKLYSIEKIIATTTARKISEQVGQSAEKVEVALKEASKILREQPTLITKTRHGIITDFSGIDESNAPPNTLIALPDDPDESARQICNAVKEEIGFKVPVIITDTQGRPWRKGAVNLAIGVAGMSPFIHNVGKEDLYGKELRSSLVCLADQIAAASELVMGQAGEGIPIVIARGIKYEDVDGKASQILRSFSENLFE